MTTIESTIALPKTTQKCYLTGMTALNIPAPEGTTGDWHFEESFWGRGNVAPKFFVAGEDRVLNTNPVWDVLGVYECSGILRVKGIAISLYEKVYAANHCRAILDLLYRALKNLEYPHHIAVDDWLDIAAEKKRLFDNLPVLNSFLKQDEKIILKSWVKTQY